MTEGKEYAILTNEIYKEWSGMTAKEYKQYKGLRKESLRDNMDNIEIILTDLSEETAKRLAEKHKPQGLEQNKEVARMGGHATKVARENIEKSPTDREPTGQKSRKSKKKPSKTSFPRQKTTGTYELKVSGGDYSRENYRGQFCGTAEETQ